MPSYSLIRDFEWKFTTSAGENPRQQWDRWSVFECVRDSAQKSAPYNWPERPQVGALGKSFWSTFEVWKLSRLSSGALSPPTNALLPLPSFLFYFPLLSELTDPPCVSLWLQDWLARFEYLLLTSIYYARVPHPNHLSRTLRYQICSPTPSEVMLCTVLLFFFPFSFFLIDKTPTSTVRTQCVGQTPC